MPDRSPPASLRVEPAVIPALRSAFSDAAAEVERQVTRLRAQGELPEAWLGDETSAAVRDHYHRHVLRGEHGPVAALAAYAVELRRVHDVLLAAETRYLRTESAVAGVLGSW